MINLKQKTTLKATFSNYLMAACLLASPPSFAQPTPLTPLPRDQLQTMAAVFGMINSDLVKDTDPAALIIAGVRGIVREADPDSGAYLDPKEFDVFKNGSTEPEVTSGLQLEKRDGRIVLQPMLGGSALVAGVLWGDVLYAVDGKRVANMEPHQVAALLAGPQGSSFSVTVFRESTLTVLTLPVERRPTVSIKPSVTAVAPGVALLKVPRYRNDTLQDTAAALKEAWQQDPFRRGLILDLRRSPGGLLSGAIGLASLFLPEDAVVASTHGRLPASNAKYKAAPAFYTGRNEPDPFAGLSAELRAVPLAVLIDASTMSGAEIVAAALKDHRRATLLGQKTWGSGSIQTVRPLSPTDALKITTAYWFSPNGARLHGAGVMPDVILANPGSDSAVQDAVAALSASRQAP
ncbi:carboxyl-terminal processing protease [Rhodoferax sp. OV413]|uniref:S41 family peptidase n=1 Tax=Rhodoferax sp. OV413 TaxID=1855285 RepID=UPI000884FFEC|nr:S41 family peptidase [Rhodoferax sp. OV413]SDP94930.1 carboxyl-terminal processing protease [Rhodoferax sp. OV413]